MKKATERYNLMAKGENKGDILGEFLADLQPVIFEYQNKTNNMNRDEGLENRERLEYEKRIQLLEKKLQSAEN